MRRTILNTTKFLLLFLCCTLLFYFGLRAFHEEYERYQRYEEPAGQAVKVFLEEHKLMDYIDLFFRLGE